VYTYETEVKKIDEMSDEQAMEHFIREKRKQLRIFEEQQFNKLHGDTVSYKEGDLVLISAHRLANSDRLISQKLLEKRYGPYIIVREHKANCYLVKDYAGITDDKVVNVRQVILFLSKEQLKEIEDETRCKSVIDKRTLQQRINDFLRVNERKGLKVREATNEGGERDMFNVSDDAMDALDENLEYELRDISSTSELGQDLTNNPELSKIFEPNESENMDQHIEIGKKVLENDQGEKRGSNDLRNSSNPLKGKLGIKDGKIVSMKLPIDSGIDTSLESGDEVIPVELCEISMRESMNVGKKEQEKKELPKAIKKLKIDSQFGLELANLESENTARNLRVRKRENLKEVTKSEDELEILNELNDINEIKIWKKDSDREFRPILVAEKPPVNKFIKAVREKRDTYKKGTKQVGTDSGNESNSENDQDDAGKMLQVFNENAKCYRKKYIRKEEKEELEKLLRANLNESTLDRLIEEAEEYKKKRAKKTKGKGNAKKQFNVNYIVLNRLSYCHKLVLGHHLMQAKIGTK